MHQNEIRQVIERHQGELVSVEHPTTTLEELFLSIVRDSEARPGRRAVQTNGDRAAVRRRTEIADCGLHPALPIRNPQSAIRNVIRIVIRRSRMPEFIVRSMVLEQQPLDFSDLAAGRLGGRRSARSAAVPDHGRRCWRSSRWSSAFWSPWSATDRSRPATSPIASSSTASRNCCTTSPRRVWAIARLAIKESFRRRVIVALVVFFLILLFAGWFLQDRLPRAGQAVLQLRADGDDLPGAVDRAVGQRVQPAERFQDRRRSTRSSPSRCGPATSCSAASWASRSSARCCWRSWASCSYVFVWRMLVPHARSRRSTAGRHRRRRAAKSSARRAARRSTSTTRHEVEI